MEISDAFAAEFVETTFGWSEYYLYDTPTSRRPWLNRPPQWKAIDELLGKYEHCKV